MSDSGVSERGRETRRRLLDAARVLFTERGYHDTRPQDIARHAGVGHGTFYIHFADKRACFLAFADEAADEIDALVEERIATSTAVPDLVHGVLDAMREHATRHPGVAVAALVDPDITDPSTVRLAPRLVDRWAGRWALHLERLSAQVSSDLDLLVVGYALVGLLHQTSAAMRRGAFPPAALEQTVVLFVERALRPQG